jgi:hypothetical protein
MAAIDLMQDALHQSHPRWSADGQGRLLSLSRDTLPVACRAGSRECGKSSFMGDVG